MGMPPASRLSRKNWTWSTPGPCVLAGSKATPETTSGPRNSTSLALGLPSKSVGPCAGITATTGAVVVAMTAGPVITAWAPATTIGPGAMVAQPTFVVTSTGTGVGVGLPVVVVVLGLTRTGMARVVVAPDVAAMA